MYLANIYHRLWQITITHFLPLSAQKLNSFTFYYVIYHIYKMFQTNCSSQELRFTLKYNISTFTRKPSSELIPT